MKLTSIRRSFAVFIMGVLLASNPLSMQGQSLLNRVKSQAEHTMSQKLLQETDKAVSNAIDKGIDSAGSRKEKSDGSEELQPKTPIDTASTKQASPIAYSKYDFVPGDSVLYANNFAGEAIGELPTGWNSNKSAVIVSLDGVPDQWLSMAQGGVTLTDNEQRFGTDFTVEFDLIMHIDFQGYIPPAFRFGLLDSGDEPTTSNRLLSDPKGDKSFYMEISPLSDAANLMLESYDKYTRYFHSPAQKNTLARSWYDKPAHVAIQVQKERLRIWVDGEKLYEVPKGIPKQGQLNQLFFQLGSSSYRDEQVGVYVGNVKIAKGVPDIRHQLVENGSFNTTGILFYTGSATIKAESAGVLKSIGEILTQHPEIKLGIIGHTDAVGDGSANLALSERRAAAVREALLAHYQVDGTRLESAGKGESEPISDNGTEAGRAQNRRVEFVKL